MSEKTIGLGTKVRTAAVLSATAWDSGASTAGRRPGVEGVAIGVAMMAAGWLVRHEDGSRAPYLRDELTPIPDEKAAPTTPIGRLRATICDVTGASIFIDQWEKIDAGLREVEGQIASLRTDRDLLLAGVKMAVEARGKAPAANVGGLLSQLVGPMPVEKAADPLVALHAERRDLEKARRTRTLYLPEATRLEALTAEIDRLEVEEARQRGEAWTRSEPVQAARPRVGGWVEVNGGHSPAIYDANGHAVASAWERPGAPKGEAWAWNTRRPFTTPASGECATAEEAQAAALAVLATWADVEGQPEAVPVKTTETWPCDMCGQPMVSEPAKAPAPPLSLVVAFGSEGAPVILEAAGPWEGIEERPAPPSRGLWRWLGKATREPLDIGGHDFEGTWTALPVPA